MLPLAPLEYACDALGWTLRDKGVLLTGAGGGIGRALALALADQGCRLCLTDRDEAELAHTQEAVTQRGARSNTVVADLSLRRDVERLVRDALFHLGNVDVLLNNGAACCVALCKTRA